MDKPNALQLLLQRKREAQRAGAVGILKDARLSRRFCVGEKPQPILRRGGRNGSGKP